MGPNFNFSDFCPLGPPGIFRKVSVVIPEEQPLPITQKRHGHMALTMAAQGESIYGDHSLRM